MSVSLFNIIAIVTLSVVCSLLRTVTLMIGFENTYNEQSSRTNKLKRISDKQKVSEYYFKIRFKMVIATLGYWGAIIITTAGIILTLTGGITMNKVGKIAIAGMGIMTLSLVLFISLYDYREALKDKSSGTNQKPNDPGRGTGFKPTSYIKIPVHKDTVCKTEDTKVDSKINIPKPAVANVGDTAVINIEELGITSTVPREPLFKKTDAADKFIESVKKLYRDDETDGAVHA